jgi:hypothetical protein
LGAPELTHACLIGCDFSSSPSKRKPIVVARGSLLNRTPAAHVVQLDGLLFFQTLNEFLDFLNKPSSSSAPCIGGFDLPFGLPREFVAHMGWPTAWADCMAHYCALSRPELRLLFKAFCDARPTGSKFAHRATDLPAGSSPSMKWVNPPVAWMMHAGVPLLRQAGWTFPYMEDANPQKIALEAYPGLLAREVVGHRSYKSDDQNKQTPDRWLARKEILHALDMSQTKWGLRLKLKAAQHDALVADASGDALDAVLCLVQAAWAWVQHEKYTQRNAAEKASVSLVGAEPGAYGLPKFDPLEGWIVGA